MGRRLAVAALLLAVGCTGEKAPTAKPSPTSPDAPFAIWPDELVAAPAPAVHQDRYAGFQLSIPKGWFHFSISGIYSFAPSKSRLAAHPEIGDWADASTYTVLVIAHQDETFAESVERSRNSHGDEGSWKDQSGRTAGRTSRTMLHRDPPTSDRYACPCVDEYTVIQWSQETVLTVYVHAGSDAAFKQFQPEATRIKSSLRVGPVDHRGTTLRDFLRARVAGSGAEEWLTSKSAYAFEYYGLYTIIDSGRERIHEYSIDETAPSEYATTYFVSIGGRAPNGDETGRTERIVIGRGRDLSGRWNDELVVEMTENQAPGTS